MSSLRPTRAARDVLATIQFKPKSGIAAPMVGGMITASPLSMFVVLVMYLLLRRRREWRKS